jgi:hypothetical protein
MEEELGSVNRGGDAPFIGPGEGGQGDCGRSNGWPSMTLVIWLI